MRPRRSYSPKRLPWPDPATVVPVVRKARVGWLASTHQQHPYRIGAVGGTAEEAQDAFFVALQHWSELRDSAGATGPAHETGEA